LNQWQLLLAHAQTSSLRAASDSQWCRGGCFHLGIDEVGGDSGRSAGWLDVGQLGRDTNWASELADGNLPTELFVDLRDLITTPQMASYDIWQALLTFDPTTISQSIETGLDQVGTAITQFPVSVIDDIIDAVGTGALTSI
jgi:hypothetical protein